MELKRAGSQASMKGPEERFTGQVRIDPQAISALDFGDYAMAISLFKRALRDLNLTMSTLAPEACTHSRALSHYREEAVPRLFDLREVWLRVMGECREELARPSEDGDEEDED